MPHSTTYRHQAVPLEQAAREAPVLGQLLQRMALSQQCAAAIAKLVPPGLRAHVRYSAVTDGEWCVLVANNAAAAKLRQLTPAWLGALQRRKLPVTRIRLRVER